MRVSAPGVVCALPQPFLLPHHHVATDGGLQLEHEPGANGPDDVGRAALFPRDRIGQVLVADRVHVRHRAAPWCRRHAIGDEFSAYDENSRSSWPADELVWRDEHGVEVRRTVDRGPHVDRHVRRGGGVVPERQRAVLVQQRRHRGGVEENARHVGRGGETADELGAADRRTAQSTPQPRNVTSNSTTKGSSAISSGGNQPISAASDPARGVPETTEQR